MARRNRSKTLDQAVGLYGEMLVIRRAEERLQRLFADGEVPGFLHLSIGQEAVAVGVAAALRADDTLASTHRGHGHALARGMALDGFFAELMGKEEGICRGRGGSMHVADTSIGMLGANGIVGAGLSIAVGSALAHQVRGRDAVAVAFFGDGSMAEGALHESMNLASIWRLPLLFVCENNGWGEFSPTSEMVAPKLQDLAAAFKIPATEIDGGDVELVARTATKLRREILKAGGPRLLECEVQRFGGHFEGDPQKYRDAAELADLERHDPIRRCVERLAALGLDEAERDQVEAGVEARIEAAVAAARAGSAPLPKNLSDGVYRETA
jgi:pyruvate dehydrogenase E1 component alpha subunit